jgi:hypothetical protein
MTTPWTLSLAIQYFRIFVTITLALESRSFIVFFGLELWPFWQLNTGIFYDHLELLHSSSDIPAFSGGAFNAFRDLQSARRDYEDAGGFVLMG